MSDAPPPSDRLRQAERIRRGQIAFNRGEFFAAHEQWEEVWLELKGGERMEFGLYGKDFGLLVEGDEGVLTYQGTRYHGFDRRPLS